ncbi:PaaX family transcriptional regulator [Phytohabitans rumicis]|uniref:PaaX family transcriptional regulator n=1 Tax=Phytohabitans rumicis TaxID=1076125 RepID=A0A6V8LMS6_9ACTN|nr:PaaX family transcriptional regulator C-terminal domain-containing protein [Phytohabitans rumicis]GFJ96178.1 PaaX family transcriptional regulator [Phytohabitans rumicis]
MARGTDTTTRPVLTRRHSVGAASARSLLLTVLGEFALPSGKPAWTSALVHVLGGLGAEEKSARQAIARTAADGWIVSERDGRRVRWVLTPVGRRLLTEGTERIYTHGASRQVWDGRWLIVMATVPETQRKLRHKLQTQLAWAGFGNPTAGMWVSPHPEREAEVKQIMHDLGLDATALSFTGPFAGVGSERSLVQRAWDLDDVEAHYEAFMDEFSGVRPEPGDATLLAQVRLVHEWRRFPFLDPLLPDELLPPRWLGQRARTLFDTQHAAWQDGARQRWEELSAAG